MTRFFIVSLTVFLASVASALGPEDRQAFLKVNPLAGETKTTKSGHGTRGVLGLSSATRNLNTSKTVSRNMRWNCEVRYRGKSKPEKIEVKVFYIGYEGKDTTPKILGKDVKRIELDGEGKASVELESPTVKYSKTRSSSGGGYSGHVAKTKSSVSGQRMEGCVVQLWEDGELVKSYASRSQWDFAAKNKDFNDQVLGRKEKNRLN